MISIESCFQKDKKSSLYEFLDINRTLKCKVKWVLALVKGIRDPHEVKKKSFDLSGNLCVTICVLSATRHSIHMYPYFLFAAIHHPNLPQLSLSDLIAQSAE